MRLIKNIEQYKRKKQTTLAFPKITIIMENNYRDKKVSKEKI